MTEDVWTVAVVIAPVLVEKGELRQPLEAIAARTGLSVHRVNECLRMLRKHACIHPRGATGTGHRCTCSTSADRQALSGATAEGAGRKMNLRPAPSQ